MFGHKMGDVMYVTRQTMYVQRNVEARLSNNCCSGKAIRIAYSELVALCTQIAMRMGNIVICGLPGRKVFSKLSRNKSY
jgi:hypothetical protein